MGGTHFFFFISWTVYLTGGALNVARAFGPAVVTGFPHKSHWVVRNIFFEAPH